MDLSGGTRGRLIEMDGKIYLQRFGLQWSKGNLGAWREPRICSYHDGTSEQHLVATLLDVSDGVGFSAKWVMLCLIEGKIVTLRSLDDGENWALAAEN